MIARALAVLALATPVSVLAQSPHLCPWLNTGTAAKILGSDVTVTSHSDSNWSGSCRFVQSTAPAASIEITVSKTDSHACRVGATPLTGIGNEAVLCPAQDANGQTVQTVSGRVREAWFVVVLATTPAGSQPAPATSDPSAFPPIEFLAEQVAGNLY